jgi:hypothetical protein
MMMEEEKLIAWMDEQVRAGKDYDDIRRELETKGLTPEAFKEAVLLIDDRIVRHQLQQQYRSQQVGRIIAGGIVLTIGIVFKLGGNFSGMWDYLLGFGPILLGAYILKEGYKKYRQPLEIEDPSTGNRGRFGRF